MIPDDPPPIGLHYEGPQQQPAQVRPGPTAPHDHDRREPVAMPAQERELRAQIEHIRRGDRFPANDPVYQELQRRLRSMEAERSEEEGTAEYEPVPTAVNQGEPINRLNGVASRLAEHHMFNSANEIGIAILEIAELTTQRDTLLAAAREVIESLDEGRIDTGNAPGHGHRAAGIWDADNRVELAGKPCARCWKWALLKTLVAKSIAPSGVKGG